MVENSKKMKDIAIIGIAGKFPLADNIEDFWDNLKNGRDCIRNLPANRVADFKSIFGKVPTGFPLMGYLEVINQFDADFFDIPPGEVPLIDPSQRLLIETVYHALEYGGYTGDRLAATNTGVFVSSGDSRYRELIQPDNYSMTTEVGNLPAILASRISHFFDFRGPSLLIDTACSSSLAAIHYACESINHDECNMAVVAAINIYAYLEDIKGEIRKEDNKQGKVHCSVFDNTANGVLNGEGVAAILLKPLSQAVSDGDNICAVIKGTGLSHNGARTATISGQKPEVLSEVLQQAIERANINPGKISYIEASGAATQMGDPIEIKAISHAFAKYTDEKQYCCIGSLKPNIGHLNHTSGLASVIKVIMSMRNKQIPPLAKFNKPNPFINFENSPVYINSELKKWDLEGNTNQKRLAGVSSFSVSGTNCHIIIEEPTQQNPSSDHKKSCKESNNIECINTCHPQILTFSAKTPRALERASLDLKDFIQNNPEYCMADICFTKNVGVGHFKYRWSAVGKTHQDFLKELEKFDLKKQIQVAEKNIESNEDSKEAVFLFSGYREELEKLGWDFYQKDFIAKRYMEDCAEIYPLQQYPQVLCFAFQYAMAQMWIEMGFKPAFVLGVGIGKNVARVISNQLSLSEGIKACVEGKWSDNSFNKEKFTHNIDLLYSKGQKTFIEIAPGDQLGVLTNSVLEGKSNFNVLFSYDETDYEAVLLKSLSKLYQKGLIDYFSTLRPGKLVPIPLYPFDRSRYWVNGIKDIQKQTSSGTKGILIDSDQSAPSFKKKRPLLKSEYVPPKSEYEKLMVHIVQQFLGMDKVGVHDNFFELGINSLSLLHINNILKQHINIDIPIVLLFEYPTIRSLEKHINELEKQGIALNHGVESADDIKKRGKLLTGASAQLTNHERKSEKATIIGEHKNTEEKIETGIELAVIGMSGRFPQANNIKEYWNNLLQGIEAISFFSNEELENAGVDAESLKNPHYIKVSAVLEHKEYFDSSFFGYSPLEAETMDPQLRLLHECCWEALEDSGYTPDGFNGLIGLYAGSTNSFNWKALSFLSGKSNMMGDLATSLLIDNSILTTRVSHKLDLKGPSISILTTCSTSLVAIHQACRSLLTGECDIALAGGVSISAAPKGGYLYQEGMVFSPDGHCRTFDARAKGSIFGEGIGIVVLKRFKRAIQDRDNTYAIVKGSAINNDGMDKVSFTAPSKTGQQMVVKTALDIAGVSPESIGYIETHGTATTLGDPIEVQALKDAFGTDKKNFCGLGSVKSNIGHLDCAAGVAGFIKTVMALKHRMIPPSLNYESTNPNINFMDSPFYVVTKLTPWESNGNPLRAGVSSFGMGGTNAHIILEEAPVKESSPETRTFQLLAISARTESALDLLTERYGEFLKKNPDVNLADMAYTMQMGRKAFQNRRILVSGDAQSASRDLLDMSTGNAKSFNSVDDKPSIVFMFPGQGAQYVNMGLELYQKEEVFRVEMENCFEILSTHLSYDIKEILYPENSTLKSAKINQTEISQPLLFSFEYSLAKLLMKWGIAPTAMIGHSIGEYVAACLSGVISLKDALKLVVLRGQLMQKMPGGSMLGVAAAEKDLQTILSANKSISLAAVNASSQCVLSGETHSIDLIEKQLKERGLKTRRLHTSHAFHSEMMEPILVEFEDQIQSIAFNPPQLPFVSNVSGKWMVANDAINPSYWSKHIRITVRFADGLNELLKKESAVFIEVGPGTVLSSFLKDNPGKNSNHLNVNLIRHPKEEVSDEEFLLKKLGLLWLYGLKIDWGEFYRREKRNRISLPTYPFEGQPYWIETKLDNLKYGLDFVGSPAKGKDGIDKWSYIPLWKQTAPTSILDQMGEKSGRKSNNGIWVVFVDDHGWVSQLLSRLKNRYMEPPQIIVVRRGEVFMCNSENDYSVDCRNLDDYKSLFQKCKSLNQPIQKVLHFWGVTHETQSGSSVAEFSHALDIGFYSLLYIVQAMEEVDLNEELEITVVTSGMHEISGVEEVEPGIACVLGALKVIPQEYAHIKCRCIDVLPSSLSSSDGIMHQWKNDDFLDCLISDFNIDESGDIIAYRGNHNFYRWQQVFEPLNLGIENSGISLIKSHGAYLITGGLGRIGILLAEFLVEHHQVNLILCDRLSFPPRENWAQWLKEKGEQDLVSKKINAIQELEKKGAKVWVTSVDVCDEEQMRGVFSQAKTLFKKIDGVFHAAGMVRGDMMTPISQMGKSNCEEQFKAKGVGLLVLEKMIEDYSVEFCFLFSSLASILGGLGHAAYSAANIFMDFFVKKSNRRQSTRWISVNWDGWNLDEEFNSEEPNNETSLKRGINRYEGIELLKRILTHSAQNQIVICKGDLHRRIDQWLRLKSFNDQTASEKDSNSITSNRKHLSAAYIKPRNQIEQDLVNIWESFFGIAPLGIIDDFFELGGDSLKAITLSSKLHKKFHVSIPLAKLFEKPNIKELAGFIAGASKENFAEIVAQEEKEYYPLSSAQNKIYFFQVMNKDNISYNSTSVLSVKGDVDREQLEITFKKLITRHESFRTSFHLVAGEPVQRVLREAEFHLENIEVDFKNNKEETHITGDESDMNYPIALKPKDLNGFIRPFDLSNAPLIRVALIKLARKNYFLVVDVHHIISDGVSVGISIGEFVALFKGENLMQHRIHYKDFSEWQNSKSGRAATQKQEEFWIKEFKGEIPVINIPTDFQRPSVLDFAGEIIHFQINKEDTSVLKSIASEKEVTLFMILLAVTYVFYAKISRQEDIVIGTATSGRRHTDLHSIIGMFVNTLALRNYPTGNKTFSQFLQQVKEKTIQAFENESYPFEELVGKLGIQRDTSRNPLFDVMFTYHNELDNNEDNVGFLIPGMDLSFYNYHNQTSKFDMCFIVTEGVDWIHVALEYSKALFKKDTIDRFIDYYQEILAKILENIDIKLEEITISHNFSVSKTDVNQDDYVNFSF